MINREKGYLRLNTLIGYYSLKLCELDLGSVFQEIYG